MPEITKLERKIALPTRRKKVAAYARVSFDTEQSRHSYAAQVSHYSRLIQSNPLWDYAGVYSDDGVTGTLQKLRKGFKELIADCDAGKIDIILVKSISRFGRNTLELLETTRHLKSIGVEVRFERENISSLSADGELLLTLLASFAQEESDSISRNGKWAVQKKFERGIPNTALRAFGYDWDAQTKTCVINEVEAEWVRYIYRRFLEGASIKGLTAELQAQGVKGRRGEPMSRTTVRNILSNCLYVGDILLQKTFNERPHVVRRNRGEMQQFLIEDAHEPIISREDFKKAQERLDERARAADNYGYQKTKFAGIVKCGKCGYSCGHVKFHGTGSDIQCNRYKTKGCDLLPIKEDELQRIMDETLKKRDILEKIVLCDDHVDFHLKGGTIRTAARKFSTFKTCFSGKLFCGECGASFVRQNLTGKKDIKTWGCSSCKSTGTCENRKRIKEEELIAFAKKLTGMEDYEFPFYLQTRRCEVFEKRIVAHMKDGRKITWKRR